MRPQVMKIPHSPAMQQTLGRYAISPPRALEMAYRLATTFKTKPPKKNTEETAKVLNWLGLHSGYQNQLDTNVTKAKNKCSDSCVVTGWASSPIPPIIATTEPARTRKSSSLSEYEAQMHRKAGNNTKFVSNRL